MNGLNNKQKAVGILMVKYHSLQLLAVLSFSNTKEVSKMKPSDKVTAKLQLSLEELALLDHLSRDNFIRRVGK